MNLMELNKKIDILADINAQMSNYYEHRKYGNRECFTDGKGCIFIISGFPGRNALVIEYADNEADAAKGLFEDGDSFYLEDYKNVNDLLRAMLSEIKDA